MALKIGFCLHQCAKKRDKYICSVPSVPYLEYVFGITSSNQPGAESHLCLCQSPPLPQMMFVLYLNRRHPLYYKIGFT